jgi:hypothetical protein
MDDTTERRRWLFSSKFSEHQSRWIHERSEWRSAVLKCPVLGPSDHGVLLMRVCTTFATVALVLFVMVEEMIHQDGIPYYLIWLTNWTGMLTACYAVTFCCTTFVAAAEASRKEDDISSNGSSESTIPLVVRVFWGVKAAAPTFQIVINIMYWAILYNPAWATLSAVNVIAHGGIGAMTVLDLLATSRVPFGKSVLDLLHTYYFGLTYLGFNLIFTLIPGSRNQDGQPYVYEIMAWKSNPGLAIIIVTAVIVVFIPVSFAVALGMTALRDRVTFPEHSGAASNVAAPDTNQDEMRGRAYALNAL